MADTRRATAGVSWRLGFAGELPQSKASAPVCQDGRLAARNAELSAALREAERQKKELEIALKQAERKITELNDQVLSQLLESASKEPFSGEATNLTIALPPDGHEVFLPTLDPQRSYQVTIQGTCSLVEGRFRKDPTGRADALYQTNKQGAFLDRHAWLYVDGEPLARLSAGGVAEICEQDREAHRYSFEIDGNGQKRGISFRPWPQAKIVGTEPSCLAVSVELLPEDTPSLKARCRQREEAASKKERSEEYQERKRTDDELAQMDVAIDRQEKIVAQGQASIDRIQKRGDLSDENKKLLIDGVRAVLVVALKEGRTNGEQPAESEEPKEPHVL